MSRVAHWKKKEFEEDPFYQLMVKYAYGMMELKKKEEEIVGKHLREFLTSMKEPNNNEYKWKY